MTTNDNSTSGRLDRTVALWGACLWAVLSFGCSGDDTVAAGGSGGVGGSVGGGGAAGSGGHGGTAGTTATGGSGGQGGEPVLHPGVLVDDGLVARYYLDEAASGQGPTEVLDTAPDPLPLPLTYVNVAPDQFMTYTEDDSGNRGLAFAQASHDDRASIALDGTKIYTALQGGQTVTYEVVANVQAVSPYTSRLLHIGIDTDHTLSIETGSVTRLGFALNNADLGEVPVDLKGIGRAVLHGVLDTSQAEPAARLRTYVNGAKLPIVNGTLPQLAETIEFGTGRHFVIGNREIGDRSIEGAIYYAAVYSVPLSEEQVLQNVAVLLVDDDTPAGGAAD